MIKGRKTFKAWAVFAVLLSFLVAGLRLSGSTQAIYTSEKTSDGTRDCFELAYKVSGLKVPENTDNYYNTSYGGTEYNAVQYTQKICESPYRNYQGKDLKDTHIEFQNVTGTINHTLMKYPNFDAIDENGKPIPISANWAPGPAGIRFKYCSNGPLSPDYSKDGDKCQNEDHRDFYRKDYKSFKAFAEAIQKFAEENMANASDKYSLYGLEDNNAPADDETPGSSGTLNSIYAMCKEAGLKGLSWVACPVMDGSATTISAMDAMIGNWLRVDTELYNSSSSTYKVWDVMRDIANVVLIIVLLVIIFSQITGFGIDNYGIKKMLPRLIAMAILVNLSFVACQLAIDISNILGLSLNTLFRGIGASIMPDDAAITNFLATAVTSLFAAVGIVGAIGGAAIPLVGVVGGGLSIGWIVIVILLALIPVLLAVLLFFVMLGARMILIILCTAVAPIVAVLYILPNTQKWAKKWVSMFSAILVMYPLCGAIGGISYLIKAMVLSMSEVDFWMMIIGVIAPFLPFFLLPTLLKNALYALGGAGAALMAMGRSWQNGVRSGAGAVQNTEGYREAMGRAQEAALAKRSQRIIDRLGAKKNLSLRDKERLYRAQNVVNQRRQNEALAKTGAFELTEPTAMARAEASKYSQETQSYQDQYASFNYEQLANLAATAGTWYKSDGSGDTDPQMSALISTMNSRGMENKVFEMLGSGVDVSNSVGVMQTLAGSNNRVMKAYGKIGSGVSYSDFMEGNTYRQDGKPTNSQFRLDQNGQQVLGDNGKPIANDPVSMAGYTAAKSGEFVDGLEDKALGEIAKWDSQGSQIMSTPQLTQAAAALTNGDSIKHLNSMLENRSNEDLIKSFSPDQLAHFDASTIEKVFEDRVAQDSSVKIAVLKAYDTIMADPKLKAALHPQSKVVLNRIRQRAGLSAYE